MMHAFTSKNFLLRGGVLLLPFLAASIVAWWWCFVPVHYIFDASKAQTAATFGWTAAGDTISRTQLEARVYPRHKTATVILPNLATYTEPSAANIHLAVENGTPSKFALQSTALSQAEALDRVRYWSKLWNFDVSEIGQWQNQVRRNDWGPLSVGRVARRVTPGAVDVWLEIRGIEPENDTWFVTLNVYWHPKEGGN